MLAIAVVCPELQAKDLWHAGKIEYTHSLEPAKHGVVPPNTRLVLDDGAIIDISTLQAGDVFLKLIDYWSRERTDYRAAPPFVDQFMFRLKGGHQIEINYTANDMYGHRWKGTTTALPPN
jgi:hypothetical protein